jgi:CDP-diacylglycerol--glycerol-3-phosphate 3-phosphatidyltransferase
MIKTATLMVLAWRFLRSPRRAAVVPAITVWLVEARVLAKRVHSRWRVKLPALLISFRAALGPGVILLSFLSSNRLLLVACVGLALLSDIFDGVLARRWRLDTAAFRRWDTRADTFFYACVLVVVLLRFPAVFERRWPLITALIAAEVAQHLVAIIKYHRHASYHSILSKIWGLLLAAAMIALLGWNVDTWFLDLAIGWGILCNLQGLAMTLLLPTWHRDVLTLFHAWRLRSKALSESRPRAAHSRAWW